MSFNFTNFSITINTFVAIIFFVITTIIYVGIFSKHHKRNKLNYVEISEIFMSYTVLMIISTFILLIAFDLFLTGLEAIEYRRERYANFISSVIMTSIVVWNFIRFLKHNLKDIEISEKETTEKKTLKVGEVLQLIFFIIIMFTPIWRIPEFLKLIENKIELIKQILISFFYSILAIFLLVKLNPLDIKNKLKLK